MADGGDQDAIARELARTYGVPAVRRAHFERVDAALTRQLPARLARKHRVVPVGITRGDPSELVLAMVAPDDAAAIDEIGFATGARIRIAVAVPALIDEFLDRLYGPVPEIQLPPAAPAAPAPVDPRFGPRREDDGALELGVELPPRSAPPPMIATPVLALPQTADVPAAIVRSSGTGLWIKLVPALLGALLGWWVVDRVACNGSSSPVEIGGKPYHADHIGMDMVLPPGWYYAPGEDRRQKSGGITQYMSVFYRGADVDDPERALAVATADTKGALPIPIPPALFEQMLRGLQLGGTQSSSGMTTRLRNCAPSNARTEQTGECDGTAVYRGKSWNVKMYLWVDPSGWICIAGYLTVDPIDQVQAELIEILANLHLRR